MYSRARSLVAVGFGARQWCFKAYLAQSAQLSNISRDVAEANQELDIFFGASNTPRLTDMPPTSAPAATSSEASTMSGCGHPSPPPPASYTWPAGASPASTLATADGSDQAGLGAVAWCGHSVGHAVNGRDYVTKEYSGPGQPQPDRGQGQGQDGRLTHIDSSGSAAMVDVSQKAVTTREAQASCRVSLGAAYGLVASNALAKGDVLKVAQLAGICGAKATASLIPLCHNIPISKVDVQLHLDEPSRCVVVRALARTDGKTGVEMEALTAATVAALTVYDMCKAAAKDLVVSGLQLDYKAGGRSGTYLRDGLRRADLLPSARPPL